MKKYKIFPLLVSRIYADIGTFNYTNFSGEKRWYPIFSFLIQGDGRNVLIDSGCVAEEMAAVSALKAGYELTRFGWVKQFKNFFWKSPQLKKTCTHRVNA